MKTLIAATLLSASLLPFTSVQAKEVTVEITNLTNGLYFTPLLVSSHDRNTHLYELGSPANPALQAMAEGGDLTGLVDQVITAGGEYVTNPAGGLLGPGMQTQAVLDADRNNRARLSLTAMLLPTNDGFVGIDSLQIPKKSGVYTYYADGYDAGTEANNEIVNGGGAPGTPGIPADPGGFAGTGGSGVIAPDLNSNVHIHRGNLGDQDPTGGVSDLDSGVHHWMNPVAKVVITVKRNRWDDID